MDYKYLKNLKTGSIYRTAQITFSNGDPSVSLERWNWDFENWNGHIDDHDKTRLQIEDGKMIIPISFAAHQKEIGA